MSLTRQKLAQAVEIVSRSDADLWITFVRETAGGGDPVLPLIYECGLTWQCALIVTRSGRKIAIVGNFDAEPLSATGDWDEVIPYVQGIREPLLDVVAREATSASPRLAANFSTNDVKADGLTHGMYLLLQSYFRGTRFEGHLVSAESIVGELRSVKTEEEVSRMREAIQTTLGLFAGIAAFAASGPTERELFESVHSRMREMGLGYAWDANQDPIVNSGPDSMIGHGVPSSTIRIEPGHIVHVDLGVIQDAYSSDLQRCWYVSSGEPVPSDVLDACHAVAGAITAGAAAIGPGVAGYEVDAAARKSLVEAGYPEYPHATGHQVGRMAHDGGTILGPTWERYGQTPYQALRVGEVYTLELGVSVEGRGYFGLEEMVQVTADGVEWLSPRQTEPMVLRLSDR